jgi:hypothetical protein
VIAAVVLVCLVLAILANDVALLVLALLLAVEPAGELVRRFRRGRARARALRAARVVRARIAARRELDALNAQLDDAGEVSEYRCTPEIRAALRRHAELERTAR